MADKTIAEQHNDKCLHFTGIHKKVCDKGVDYQSVRGESREPLPFPCFRSSGDSGLCKLADFPSWEESLSYEKRAEEIIIEYLKTVEEGKCPVCKKKVKKTQVGPCVCGSCGHRMYQGKV